jgi:hypothetical protein
MNREARLISVRQEASVRQSLCFAYLVRNVYLIRICAGDGKCCKYEDVLSSVVIKVRTRYTAALLHAITRRVRREQITAVFGRFLRQMASVSYVAQEL